MGMSSVGSVCSPTGGPTGGPGPADVLSAGERSLTTGVVSHKLMTMLKDALTHCMCNVYIYTLVHVRYIPNTVPVYVRYVPYMHRETYQIDSLCIYGT